MSSDSENKCLFVSSFGIAKSVKQPPALLNKNGAQYNFNYNNQLGDTVYVRITDIIPFYKQCLHQFKNPIILITGDMDTTVPDDIPDINSILDHPNLLKWYAQNLSKKNVHPKLFHSPIGLDYHTLSFVTGNNHEWGQFLTPIQQEKQLIQTKKQFISIQNVDSSKAVTNFHHSTFGYPIRRQTYREPILKALKNKDCIVWLPQQKRIDFWNSCNQYAFVICPFGNGLDTHRTWETLILGRIPIIPKSELNELFKDLPVVEVEDEEWKNIDSEWLSRKYNDIIIKWGSYKWNKLTLYYWLNQYK
jgi:hypothetical protein